MGVCDIALKIGETMELKRNPQPSKKQINPPFPPIALKTTDKANIAMDIINIIAIWIDNKNVKANTDSAIKMGCKRLFICI